MSALLRLAAAACAALAALLAIVVHPALFLGRGGGWIAFASWYADGQWWSARLAVAALVLFAAAALADPALVHGGPRALWLAPVAAVAVLAHFVVATLPHPDNASRWASGELGLAAWRRAERARQAPPPGETLPLPATAFAGTWRAPDGSAYRFHPDRVEQEGANGVETIAQASCGDPWQLAYESLRVDAVLALNVAWTATERARVAATRPDARLDVASVWCPSRGSPVFVRVAADTVWLKLVAGGERPAIALARERD